MADGSAREYVAHKVTPSTTIQQLLHDASDLLGRKELARALQVPDSLLDSWMDGRLVVPNQKLVLLTRTLVEVADRKS